MDDRDFAQLALNLGFISDETLARLERELARRKAGGEPITLRLLMSQRGLIDAAKSRAIEEALNVPATLGPEDPSGSKAPSTQPPIEDSRATPEPVAPPAEPKPPSMPPEPHILTQIGMDSAPASAAPPRAVVTQAPASPTQAPADRTQAPADRAQAPANPALPHGNPTLAADDLTQAPDERTVPPGELTQAVSSATLLEAGSGADVTRAAPPTRTDGDQRTVGVGRDQRSVGVGGDKPTVGLGADANTPIPLGPPANATTRRHTDPDNRPQLTQIADTGKVPDGLLLTVGASVGATLGVESRVDLPGTQSPNLLGDRDAPKFNRGRLLGRGGMGEVFLAADRDLRRDVAIKTLLQANRPDIVARFVEEAQVTGQLEHPNIVPVYDLSLDDSGRPVMVMKCVRGQSLANVLDAIGRGDTMSLFGRTGVFATTDYADYLIKKHDARVSRDSRTKERPAAPTTGPAAPSMADLEVDPAKLLNNLLDVFVKCCDALAYSHSRSVIHRDLKPDNIMVGEFGEVLVMDWGLCKIVGRPDLHKEAVQERLTKWRTAEELKARATGKTASASASASASDTGSGLDRAIQSSRKDRGIAQSIAGSVTGTPAYMSPEQARGEDLGPLTDIYSLGAVLYEMLTLCTPYEGPTALMVLAAVAKGDLVPPSKRAPERLVPRDLEAIVLKAMSLDPKRRYQSVVELKADVQAYQAGRATTAVDYTSWQLMMKFASRNRTAMIGAAATLLVAIAALVIVFAQQGEARQREELATEEGRQEQERIEEAKRAAAMTALADELDAIESDAGAIEALIAQRDFISAVGQAQAFDADKLRRLEEIAANEDLRTSRPGEAARALTLRDRIVALPERVLADWCADAARVRDVDPAAATREQVLQAQDDFARFLAYLEEKPTRDLPVAAFALWRARVEYSRETPDEAVAATWVANAYTAQPSSVEAGRAFLLYAQRTLARGQYEQACAQLHLALSAFGDQSQTLRARVLLDLAKALGGLGITARAPFSPAVPAPTMALRCLLELAKPNGELRALVRDQLEMDADAREQFGHEVADLMFALRHVAAPNVESSHLQFPLASAGSPKHAYLDAARTMPVLLSWSGPTVAAHTATVPDQPGLDPYELEQVREVDVAAAVESAGLPALKSVRSVRLLPLIPGADQLQVLIGYLGDEAPHHLIGLRGFDDPTVFLHIRMPDPALAVPYVAPDTADLDGNGRNDLVIVSHDPQFFLVTLQNTDGTFGPLQIAPFREWFSYLDDCICGDFNGDGQEECALLLGGWAGYRVVVFDARDGRLALRADAEVGTGQMIQHPHAPDELLVAAGAFGWWGDVYRRRGEDPPASMLQSLRYTGSALERAEAPFLHRPELERGYDRVGVTPGPNGESVVVVSVHGIDGATAAWRFHRDPGLRDEPRETRVIGIRPSFGPDGWIQHRAEKQNLLCRLLTVADVATLDGKPVPRAQPYTGAPQTRVARFLMDMALYEGAIRYAARVNQSADTTSDVRTEMTRVNIAARAQLNQVRELITLARALRPDSAVAYDLLEELERAVLASRQLALGADIARTWGSVTGLTANQRAAFMRLAKQLEAASVTVSGEAALHVYGDGLLRAPTGRAQLADRVVTNDVNAVIRLGDGTSATHHWQVAPSASRPDLPADGGAAVGDEITLEGFQPFAGVPVRFDGGSYRLVMDVRVPDGAFDGRLQIGLFSVDQLAGRPNAAHSVAGVRYHVGGAVDDVSINQSAMGGGVTGFNVDPVVGRWLRIELEYLAEFGHARVVVADLDARRVLAHRLAPDYPQLPAGEYVLGVAGGTQRVMRIETRELVLHGAFALEAADSLATQALLADAWTAAATSATRARLRGDLAQQVEVLTAHAERCEAVAEAAPPAVSAELRDLAWLARLESMWVEAAADGDTFIAALTATTPADDRQRALFERAVVDWALTRAPHPDRDAVWVACGQHFAARALPGATQAQAAQQVLQVLQSGQPVSPIGALVMAWVLDDRALAADPTVTLIAAEAAWFASQQPMTRQQVEGLQRYGVALVERLPEQQRATALQPYVGMLQQLQRRKDAVAALELASVPDALRLFHDRQAMIAERREQGLAESKAHAEHLDTEMPEQ